MTLTKEGEVVGMKAREHEMMSRDCVWGCVVGWWLLGMVNPF